MTTGNYTITSRKRSLSTTTYDAGDLPTKRLKTPGGLTTTVTCVHPASPPVNDPGPMNKPPPVNDSPPLNDSILVNDSIPSTDHVPSRNTVNALPETSILAFNQQTRNKYHVVMKERDELRADNNALMQQFKESKQLQEAVEQQLKKGLDVQRANAEKLSSLTKELDRLKSERKMQDVSAPNHHIKSLLILPGFARRATTGFSQARRHH
jgi:hypothetical protein